MDPVAEFFVHNIIVVYFFYGLAFFCMGLVVWLESGRTSEFRIARAIGALAAFGILHGLHEWFEMFQKLSETGATNIPGWLLLDPIRISHLVLSFLLLVVFGVRLLYAIHRKDGNERRVAYLSAGALLIVWGTAVLLTRWLYNPSPDEFVAMIDVLSRYMIGMPGALLAAWAIILEQRSFRKRGMTGFGRDLLWAASALLLYGIVGQAFPRESILFPSSIINGGWFLETFGIPIQFFRAVEAAIMAVFVIRALRAFELERQQRLNVAQEARLVAQQQALETQKAARQQTEELYGELKQREELLGEMLHQVVSAQEGERQRIARELHDGTGQIMTGLGLGLAAAVESVSHNPELALNQLEELKRLNAQALRELHEVISDLRPSVLDDLGLVPALKAQTRQFEARTGVKTAFRVEGKRKRLQPEIETIIFRIGQEALTNVAKHASADTASVCLHFNENCLTLLVEDDGQGFDPELVLQPDGHHRTAWGLLGIQERVALVGGECRIRSRPGGGTQIEAQIPFGIAVQREDDVKDKPDPC